MLIDRLNQVWKEQGKTVPVETSLSFNARGLTLGAGTILLPTISKRQLACLEGQEARLLALLTAAYGQPVSPGILGHLDRAVHCWSKGADGLALVHLALTGLPRLADPEEAARRLFMADHLMKAGFHPANIYVAQGFDLPPIAAFEKLYNPRQNRAPKGESDGGEWIKEVSVFAGRAAAAVARFAGYLARHNEVTLAFGLLLIPSDSNISVKGDVAALPGLSYSWNRDETTVVLTYNDGKTTQRFLTTLGHDGLIRYGSAVVGQRLDNGTLAIDIGAMSGKLRAANGNQPQLCSNLSKDRPGGKDKSYEDQMKELVNPGNATPSGYGYRFRNPSTGRAVVLDDCQHTTGWAFEFKGPGYAWRIANSPKAKKGITESWIDQSGRQVAAAGNRPVVWYFAEQAAADYAKKIFDAARGGREDIIIRVEPKKKTKR